MRSRAVKRIIFIMRIGYGILSGRISHALITTLTYTWICIRRVRLTRFRLGLFCGRHRGVCRVRRIRIKSGVRGCRRRARRDRRRVRRVARRRGRSEQQVEQGNREAACRAVSLCTSGAVHCSAASTVRGSVSS